MEDSTRKLIRDYGGTVLIAVAIALCIRYFLIEAYRIPTPAMRPTLDAGDTVFVGKWPFLFKKPSLDSIRRGEVVLYSPPGDTRRDYIKRVIALPGDVVQIKSGRLWINEKEVPVQLSAGTACGTEALPSASSYPICFEPPAVEDYGPEKVPVGSFFALGDLRTGSQTEPENHNKGWGLIPISSLRGRVLWIWLSIEPNGFGGSSGGFPRLRFDRMFRRVE